MKIEFEATGATIDEAKENAIAGLSVDNEEDVQFEIIDLPQKKTFGLFGGCPAKVRAYIEKEDVLPVNRETKPSKKVKNEKISKEEIEAKIESVKDLPVIENNPITDPAKLEIANRAVEYLNKVLTCMDIKADITMSDYEGGIELTIDGENIGAVVGRRGETLDSLQYLTVLAANTGKENYQRIILNTGDYRNKRMVVLQSLAKKISAHALKDNKNIALEPMNPYERRIIHMTVHEIEGLMSWSIGSEPYRRVVIGTSKDGKIHYNNRRDGHSQGRGTRSGSRRKKEEKVVSEVNRDIKVDKLETPLYGKIEF